MKIVNKWFFFNPLFALYTDTPWFLDDLKHYNTNKPINNSFYDPIHQVYLDPFDYDVRQMGHRDSNEIEAQIVNYESANRLRKQFRENETFEDFLAAFDYEDKYEKTPIALITFVLSVLLATDFSLRQRFYRFYPGKKIPAITQWCFNTFRVSPISDESTITDFSLIDDEYRATLGCCGLGFTFADKTYLKERPKDTVTWFSLWEEHFNRDQKHYLEAVEFKRVAHVSSAKNYLCGLTVETEGVTCSETDYFQELSHRQKGVYSMLARVLDRVCVPENTELIIPHKNIVERSFDEKEIVPKLIRFIVSECKSFLT